ncbi:BatD family protein [Pseudomonas sp. SIMBA_077]
MNRFCVLLFLLCCWTIPAHAVGLTASVDRDQLKSGETVELTLESNDATLFGKPDLTPLDHLFEVRGTRQVNQLTTLSDDNQAITRWIITLQPKRTGSVIIPPLQVGDYHSLPIKLSVTQSSTSEAELAPVFIEASLDQPSVYVQAQAILTLRVYHSVALYDDSNLTPLHLQDAIIEPLGDSRTYEKLINGVRHGVIEVRYGIYPQHSGEMLIPALTFSATQVDSQPNTAPLPNNPKPGKMVHVISAQIPLLVKPKPEDYPATSAWLPARSLSLSETWNPEPDHCKVGDSLTRTLTLKAEGLSSAQLPPLPETDVNGLRRYPDLPQLSNQVTDNGMLGSREEREALVPTRIGQVELPAVEVVWWNTHEDRLERSYLPARTLQVAANASLAAQIAIDAEPGAPSEDSSLWLWQLSTVLLACTTLIGFGLWWRARRKPAIMRASQTGPSPRTLLDDIKRASLANDPHATRQALDAWARQQPETLAEMAARFVLLSDALDGLNGALYSETGHYWQGEELWKAIRSIPAAEREQDASSEASSLPPLYPK